MFRTNPNTIPQYSGENILVTVKAFLCNLFVRAVWLSRSVCLRDLEVLFECV